ncbi:MAG: DNA replication/repair protein RecF [Oscillospiraceae bacterium]|jgi:DNA replication and repair protein RecF|nr:DNA replication/repair protein RecF [Oscillospiraceae bacterium]
MRVQTLRLHQFRNYESACLRPAPGVTVLHGANAQGKTNLIEALYLCCVGRSHRTRKDAELVRWGEAAARAEVEAERLDGPHAVAVTISPSQARKKQVRINGTPVQRLGEMMGHLNAVLFSPEDLRLVKDGPEGRRRFLDMEMSQLQPAYFYALQRYARALAQRNGLLRQLGGAGASPALTDTLDAWDEQLAHFGGQIAQRRRVYMEHLSERARAIHAELSGGQEDLRLSYGTAVPNEAGLLAQLQSRRAEDLRRGSTGAGPHRDDFQILINGHEARAFASQGQQRTIALALKLSELDVMREALGEWPVLLLDDVMSELDAARRRMLVGRMEKVQTIITCTRLEDLGGAGFEAAYRVEDGRMEGD